MPQCSYEAVGGGNPKSLPALNDSSGQASEYRKAKQIQNPKSETPKRSFCFDFQFLNLSRSWIPLRGGIQERNLRFRI